MKKLLSKISGSPRARKRKDGPLSPRSARKALKDAEPKDFELIKELASGFIGKVFLARHIKSKEYFVLKTMKKTAVIQRKQLERVFNEKHVHLHLSTSPSVHQVVQLYKCMQDSRTLYLIMSYMPGDLFLLLNLLRGNIMDKATSVFVVANLVLSLESIHAEGVLYRDLKPQNVLIDYEGYPVLTDFGFAKVLNLGKAKRKDSDLPPRTTSFVGTPAYMAPEVLQRKYYAEGVDWWALGILTYEIMLGDVPFDEGQNDSDALLRSISKGLRFPRGFDPVSQDFISRLLQRKPSKRLNSGEEEDELGWSIKDHPFFSGVDWKALSKRSTPSPLLSMMPKRSKAQTEPDTRHFQIYQLYEDDDTEEDDDLELDIAPAVLAEIFADF